jgi:tetratricopeptide (TPR) repeat protein
MPKRPRSHRLEDESRIYLSSLIPDFWVFRKTEPDYGIDGEIEIFDSSGLSTGLTFFVQLKGTDIVEKDKALSIRLPIDTIKYYRSLQLPVLLIRYVSMSKEVYIKWAHEIAYNENETKSIKIVFPEERKWAELTPNILIEEIKLFRQLLNPNLPLPLEFWLDFPEEDFISVPTIIIESSIRDAAKNLSEFITFRSKPPIHLIPKIRISKDLILIDFAGLTSFKLTNTKGLYNDRESIINYIGHDIIILIALLLSRLGHYNIAAIVAYDHILLSNIINNYQILFGIISCFALGKRIDMALRLSERILDDFENKSLYRIFALPAFKKELTTDELKLFKNLILKAIDKAREKGYQKEAASCHYNLGNRLRGLEAFHHYRMASKYDDTYRNRNYFWREIAAILFLIGKFSYSEKCYKKAIELGASSECMALRADALMFSGNYKEALTLFQEYSKVTNHFEGEWFLKLWVLKGLIKTLGLEKQIRNPKRAMQLADIGDLPIEEVGKRIDEAIALDGLCGLAWFNVGVYKSSQNEYSNAFIAFLMSGISQPNDIESWVNVIICMLNYPQYDILLPHILSFAYRINGEELLISLAQLIEKQSDRGLSGPIIKLIKFINENARILGKFEKPSPITRIINPNGTHRIVSQNSKASSEGEQP